MKKYCNSKRSAFSLLELSIIILIIGVIITGVMQGQHILYESRLKTARSLTNSSIVSSIPSLRLWVETTAEDSFIPGEGGYGEDGGALTKWLDINPQSRSKIEFTGTATYKESAINGLPAIDFNGSGDLMQTDDFANLVNEFTLFIVYELDSSLDNATIYSLISKIDGTVDNSNIHVDFAYNATPASDHVHRLCDDVNCQNYQISGKTPVAQPAIFSYTHKDDPTNGQINFYLNSYSPFYTLSLNNRALNQNAGNLFIASAALDIKIAEVIIFSEVLSARDHKSVTKYLANKWAINIL